MSYDRSLRRARALLPKRRRVRCPHLRRVPRGSGNRVGAVCAARAGAGLPTPTPSEYWELCSRSAYVYCPTYLRFLLVSPPMRRVVD